MSDPPISDIFINFWRFGFIVKFSTQFTISPPSFDFPAIFDRVKVLPPKVLCIFGIIGLKSFQVGDQIFGAVKVHGVDERLVGGDGGVVGPAERHGHHVVVEDGEKLFCHVVFANGVFKTEIKSVVFT